MSEKWYFIIVFIIFLYVCRSAEKIKTHQVNANIWFSDKKAITDYVFYMLAPLLFATTCA